MSNKHQSGNYADQASRGILAPVASGSLPNALADSTAVNKLDSSSAAQDTGASRDLGKARRHRASNAECEHKWDGPEASGDNWESQTCSRCGVTAMSHDMQSVRRP